MVLAIFIVGILAVSAAGAADNATDDIVSVEEVTNTDDSQVIAQTDSEDLSAADNGTFTDLQKKISNATEYALIMLENDYAYDEGFSAEGICIDKNITIDGRGHTIDAKKQSRIFTVTAEGVYLKNITFINAKFSDASGEASMGSAVCWNADNGYLFYCSFVNNTATVPYNDKGYGGAVYWNGSNGFVSNCSFSHNDARNDGGAIYWNGSGVLSNCSFSGNRALNEGGALYWNGPVKAIIVNCSFSNNYVNKNGGAISLIGNNGTILLNCSFSDNFVYGGWGGAVYWEGCERTHVSGSVFSSNHARSNYGGGGGAICWMGCDNGTVSNCTFVDNKAFKDSSSSSENGFGGAVYASCDKFIISNSSFEDNSAEKCGGAVYIVGNEANLFNMDFANNRAELDGAAICLYGAHNLIIESNFFANSADNGGAVYVNGDDNHVFNCSFMKNNASCEYGKGGGALCMYGADNHVFYSTFTNNRAEGESSKGGAICMNGEKGIVSNCDFTGNSADSGLYANVGGGAIFFNGMADSNITGCSFEDNHAYRNGGAVNLYNCVNGIVYNSSFENNSVEYDNGGALLWYECENSTLYDCSFVKSTIGSYPYESSCGSAVCWYECDVARAISCNFTGSTASVSNDLSQDSCGGVIHFSGDELTLSKCSFVNAHVGGSGGAISLTHYLKHRGYEEWHAVFAACKLIDCSFVNCSAAGNGGAVYFDYYDEIAHQRDAVKPSKIVYGEFNVNRCSFINCSALGDGGAVYRLGSNAVINNCSFLNCSSNRDGGAVCFGQYMFANKTYSCDDCTVYDSLFADNSAGERGGAISWLGLRGRVMKSLFRDNSASQHSNIYNSSKLTLTDNIFTGPDGNSSDPRANPQITFPPLDKPSSDGSIAVELPGDAAGTVTLTINNRDYDFAIENGISKITFPDLPDGQYPYTIAYSGDVKYSPVVNQGNLTVNKTGVPAENQTVNPSNNTGNVTKQDAKLEITVSPLNNPAREVSVTVRLPEDATGKVNMTVNGKIYEFDVKNGVGNVIVPDLADGNYPYRLTYSGDDRYFSFADGGILKVDRQGGGDSGNTGTGNGTNSGITPEITIPSLDSPADDGSVTVKLPGDATGKVTLTMNGKSYDFEVKNGVAKVVIPDVANGYYPYGITYSGDGKYSSFSEAGIVNVNRASGNSSQGNTNPSGNSRVVALNTTVTYLSGSCYNITVYGADGKPAQGVDVIVAINGVAFKTVRTDINGVASFEIIQKPGTYRVSAAALERTADATLKVKHLLKLKKAKVKRSAKKLVLRASLKKVNGKYIKGAKIKFKFNGKKYNAKTNKKGVAKVVVKSNVLKKLKAGQKVKYQAKYVKDTVKKTVKVKK